MPDINESSENKHRKNLKSLDSRLSRLYTDAIERISKIASGVQMLPGSFSLKRYPYLNSKVNDVITELRDNIEVTIINGVKGAWELSNDKNNHILDKRISDRIKDMPAVARFYNPNEEALNAFITRKQKGLNLSDRVWNSVKGYRGELEAGLALGISSGKSAADMSRELKTYLKDPDKLFRRVRDKNDVLQLSNAALNYSPGQGVYRSSYKNALRLARTENNMAYRNSDQLRWNKMPFIVGQEIKLSNRHPQYDICDMCAGKYPKDFVWNGWHPQCLCFKVPIMTSDQEYEKYENALLEGKTPRITSVNKVTDVPIGFKNFIEQNSGRISGWKNTPYWVRDNFKNGNVTKGLGIKTKPEKLPVIGNYTLTPDRLNQLKQSGVVIENEERTINFFNASFQGFDLQQVFDDFEQLGKDFNINWQVKKILSTGNSNQPTVIARHIGIHNGKEIYIERNLRSVDGKREVYHAFFKAPKELQGNGLSKRVINIYYEQYKKAGIDKIKVTANIDVGGYAWAKYGFSAPEQYQILNALIYNKTASKITNQQYFRIVNKIKDHFNANPGKPFPMRKIANLGRTTDQYGKRVLLGTNWSGELDLSNRREKKIFEDYLYGKKRKK